MMTMNEIVDQLSSRWWTFVVRGIVALALAAFAFAAPGWMAVSLVYIFAAYFIVSGLLSLYAGIALTGVGRWWALVLMGAVQAALGILMLAEPGAGPLALAYLFALWLVMSGTMEISSAIALRSVINNEFWWILLGLITLAFGFFAAFYPRLGLLGLVYTVGFYAVFAGISLIGFGFRLKNMRTTFAARRATA